MNTKPIPIMITLAAAFISCVVSIMQGVDFSVFVGRLVIVVVVFLVLGTIIKIVLDYSFRTLEPPVAIDAETPVDSSMVEEDEDDPEAEGFEESSAESGEG